MRTLLASPAALARSRWRIFYDAFASDCLYLVFGACLILWHARWSSHPLWAVRCPVVLQTTSKIVFASKYKEEDSSDDNNDDQCTGQKADGSRCKFVVANEVTRLCRRCDEKKNKSDATVKEIGRQTEAKTKATKTAAAVAAAAAASVEPSSDNESKDKNSASVPKASKK